MKYLSVLLLSLLVFGNATADSLSSGLQPGENTPTHNPTHLTGPDAGTNTCPV